MSTIKRTAKAFCPPIVVDLIRKIRPAPQKKALPTGEQLIVAQGFKWTLDMAGIAARHLYEYGVWEEGTTKLVLDMVKPGMNVLSIGANFGYYALLMARAVGPNGHVWAFEPTAYWRKYLERHIRDNDMGDRITVVPFGLSDSDANLEIKITPQSASLHLPNEYSKTFIATETIKLARYDDVVRQLGIGKIDFISMDIDGHEPAFFKGAEKSIRQWMPPIAMECSARCLLDSGLTALDLLKQMKALGYELRDESTRQPWATDFAFMNDCGNYKTGDANILAVAKGR